MEQPNYWIQRLCCHNNAFYNIKFGKRTHKVRCGQVWYKGKQYYGDDIDIKTRKHHYRYSHSWVETSDGRIIDWVINDILRNRDCKVWNKKELEEKGFEWKYYVNESGICKQLRTLFGSNTKDERTRNVFGEFYFETDEEKEERKREKNWDAWCFLVLNKYNCSSRFLRNMHNWNDETKEMYADYLQRKDTFSSKDWDYYKANDVMVKTS